MHARTHTSGLWRTVVKDAMCIQVSGCAVAPFRCHNDRNQCSDQKVCRQHVCLNHATFFVHECVCVCVGASLHAYVSVLMCFFIPRGWGWEKQVRKQQNKLGDNEESNTGTCFLWCGGWRIHLGYSAAWFCDVLRIVITLPLDISVQQHALYHLYLAF